MTHLNKMANIFPHRVFRKKCKTLIEMAGVDAAGIGYEIGCPGQWL